MNVCPTKALYRSPEGFVLLNPLKCIGCMMCAVVCPFGIPDLDKANKIMVKCDFCIDRVRKGLPPACVEACPTGALRFGRLEDFLEEKSAEAARQLISGKSSSGLVVVKPVTAPTLQAPKPLDVKSKCAPVSGR